MTSDDIIEDEETPGWHRSADHQQPPTVDKQALRAVRNRQAAQASRNRKRRYLIDIEQHRAALFSENNQLRARIAELEEEKERLMGKVDDLKADFANMKSMISKLQQQQQPQQDTTALHQSRPSPNQTNLGAVSMNTLPVSVGLKGCLMVRKKMEKDGGCALNKVTNTTIPFGEDALRILRHRVGRKVIKRAQHLRHPPRPIPGWLTALMARFSGRQQKK